MAVSPRVRRGGERAELDTALLIEVRAALEAGATPTAALSVASEGVLAGVGRQLRLGRPLAEVAGDLDAQDPRADLLVRGLAVAERTGAGAADAVEQVLATAAVLTLLPVAIWALLVVLDPATLAFYATPMGLGSAFGAAALVTAARVLSGRIVARVARAPEAIDPLRGPAPRRDPVRALVLAVPVALVLGMGAGAGLGTAGAAIALAVGLRAQGPPPADLRGGGTPETAELLAIALGAGLPPVAALTEVAALGPPAARRGLADAARRLHGGWPLAEAFEGTDLDAVGAALAATARWGAPAEPALRRLAAEVRADRRAAGEAAAERAQLALLFPTTLLTLPAFVLAVVPPVLWTAFTG
jgi:hypothetical protein